ncbi:IS1/IS1595 family N-terminal zinc-binding domain-containing protein, partial [Wandonia haliotis]|uniref:IS1/IS1595 family N-terminal zinc-binding domain-containing protein n=1 Tax=Wandonia haliotis TaxID=574963 RepID=UPI003CD0C26A
MQSNGSTCIKCVDGKLTCSFFNDYVVKKGKTLKGIQRHLCKQCGSTKQEEYRN